MKGPRKQGEILMKIKSRICKELIYFDSPMENSKPIDKKLMLELDKSYIEITLVHRSKFKEKFEFEFFIEIIRNILNF
jgi:hypothetical protein